MELHLGLALPSAPAAGFDLNRYASGEAAEARRVKRDFDDAFDSQEVTSVPRTLTLLHWDKHPHEEDDDPQHLGNIHFLNKSDGDGDRVVGWPPVKSWRKKLCHPNHGGGVVNHLTVENGCGCSSGGGRPGSAYVKVKMEGVAIARKVDLTLFGSYRMLTDTLMDMFGRCKEDSCGYRLAYEDREGDWLLAEEDVPWRSFVASVRRLKLMKINC